MNENHPFLLQQKAKLQSAGADPEHYLIESLSFVNSVFFENESLMQDALLELSSYAIALHKQEFGLWNPFRFGLRPLKSVKSLNLQQLKSILDIKLSLLSDCTRFGIDDELIFQKGLQWLPESTNFDFKFYFEFLQSMKRLAARRIDPTRYVEFNAKTCTLVAGESLDAFSKACLAFENTIFAIEDRGLGYVYPFALAIQKVGLSYVNQADDFISFLPSAVELIDLLRLHNHSPYGVFEHGIAEAFAVELTPNYRSLALDGVFTLASLGTNPQRTLKTAIPRILNESIEYRETLIGLFNTLNKMGIPSDAFFDHCLSLMLETHPTIAEFNSQIAKIESLFQSGHAYPDFNFHRLFRDGLAPALQNKTLSRQKILDLSIACIEQGFDVAAILDQGLSALFIRFEEHPEIVDLCLVLAHEQISMKINPMALLGVGSKIVKSACTYERERTGEIFQALHELIITLSPDTKSPERLFNFGLQNSASAIGSNPGTLLKLIRQLIDRALSLRKEGFNAEENLNNILSSAILDTRSELVMQVGNFLVQKFMQSQIDANTLMPHFLPLLLAQSENQAQAVDLYNIVFELVLKDQSSTDRDEIVKCISDLRSKSEVTGLNREHFLSTLRMIHSLNYTTKINRFLTDSLFLQISSFLSRTALNDENSPEVKRPNSSESAHINELYNALKSMAIESLNEEDQIAFCQVILPAGLEASENNLSDLIAASELLRSIVKLIPRSLDYQELASLFRCLAERCDSPVQFSQVVSQFDYSNLSRGEFANLPFGKMAADIAEASRSRSDLLKNLDGFFKSVDSDFISPQRLEGFSKKGLPLLVQVSKLEGYYFLDCYKTLLQLAKLEYDVDLHGLVYYDLAALLELFMRIPKAWQMLVQPLPASQGKGSAFLLRCYRWISSSISTEADLSFLKFIVSQTGVRAPDILNSLVCPLLHSGLISSIEAEDIHLREFIDVIKINDPELYIQYRNIQTDITLSDADVKVRIKKLRDEFTEIARAIVRGSIPKEVEANGSFFKMLYYIFTPSYSMDYKAYESLYLLFPDHTEHITKRTELKLIPETLFEFSEGGYVLRAGEIIHTQAWNFVVAAIAHAGSFSKSMTLLELAQNLFQSWVQSEFNNENRVKLTGMIYSHFRQEHEELLTDLDSTHNLLKLKTFVEDSAQEVIHAALGELYHTEPSHFLNQSQHKIIPVKNPGRGLIKNVLNVIQDLRQGRMDSVTAEKRIKMQLRGFAGLDADLFNQLFTCDDDSAQKVLAQLKTEVKNCDPGQVYLRVYGDLLGEVAAQMNRELFGDQKTQAKIEFKKSAGAEVLKIRFQVTKSKAHAPVGFCEGVCTARDLQLWENPNFMQVVFWGPENRSYGGMHILIVEVGTQTFITLPGINPTFTFLKRVQALEIFDRCIDFAKELAVLWKLDGVLIPTNPGIHSNRVDIQKVLIEKKLTIRSVPAVQFSYSPYVYTFDQVFECE